MHQFALNPEHMVRFMFILLQTSILNRQAWRLNLEIVFVSFYRMGKGKNMESFSFGEHFQSAFVRRDGRVCERRLVSCREKFLNIAVRTDVSLFCA